METREHLTVHFSCRRCGASSVKQFVGTTTHLNIVDGWDCHACGEAARRRTLEALGQRSLALGDGL